MGKTLKNEEGAKVKGTFPLLSSPFFFVVFVFVFHVRAFSIQRTRPPRSLKQAKLLLN